MRRLKICLISFLFFGFPKIFAAEPADPGMLFLESFASSCGSRGIFTQRALNETQALQRILETIKNDEACRGIAPIFQSLIQANNQLQFLDYGLHGEEAADLQDYIDRLSYAMSLSSDPSEQGAIAYELSNRKIDLVKLSMTEAQRRRFNRTQAVQDLVIYMETVNKDFASQTLCFERNKSLPIQLAGHLLSVAGGFFDPAINLALSLSGRLISAFFSFFDDLKLNRRIADYRQTTMQSGLTCAMESLEQTLCDIQDRRDLIKNIQTYRDEKVIANEWTGYELLTRDYSVIRDFLKLVEAGSPPGTVQQAQKRASFLQQESIFRQTQENAQGLVGSAEYELSVIPVSNADAREGRLRGLVSEITAKFSDAVYKSQGEGTSVFSEVVPDPFTISIPLWLRIGFPNPKAKDAQGNPKSTYQIYEEIDQKTADADLLKLDAVANLDLGSIKKNLNDILNKIQNRLDFKRRLTLIADGQGVLTGWSSPNQEGLTPGEVLEKISHYLTNLEDDWYHHEEWFATPEMRRDQFLLLMDTRKKFDETLKILKRDPASFKNTNGETLSDEEIINEKLLQIYRTMVLKEGDQYIGDRFRQMVQLDMEKRMRAGLLQSNESLDAVVRLGTRDVIASLTPGVSQRLEPLKADLDEAEPIARANLLNFYKHFSEPLRYSIEYLRSLADAYEEGPYGVSTRKISKLCILSLNNPLIKKDAKLLSLCDGKSLGADENGVFTLDYKGRPIASYFDSKNLARPEKRICSFRRFRNQLELQEDILRHRRPRFDQKVASKTATSFLESLDYLFRID
ncbi:MAG: hypothetical protein J0L93_07785 [Deltaproteobacteria bacterium]|nr:hypothetical protein [Deltaproteobacteria bacterium]